MVSVINVKMERKNTPKKLSVAPYVRVSVKEPDDKTAPPTVDLDKLSEKEIGEGLYIPTMERIFKNSPEGDIARAKSTLEDWLRQKNRKHKTDN